MKRPIPARTQEKQRAASDPSASAWVSAHAGSGKTHVLTQRVVRLLLEGVPPSRLICLTFTKAAAANMSERVFRMLAGWTLMPDADLRAEIEKTGARAPKTLDAARRLFATAVETPGGLKIQTIHAFCERVLHLFPFEANTPADFRVVEDLERATLMQAARQQTLAAAATDAKLGAALTRVAQETWDGGFEKSLETVFTRRDLLRDVDGVIARLPAALGLATHETEAEIGRAIVEDGIDWREWGAVAAAMALGGKTDQKMGQVLLRAASCAPDGACIEDYFSFYFTDKGSLRKAVASSAIEKINPGLPERLLAEGARLSGLREKLNAAKTVARTDALLRLAADILARFERAKHDRSLLDFDDLIARTRNLLMRAGASSWVLYKLDGGIDHILVDEAQDTSLAQWDILWALAAEFTAGAGASSRVRTFFAVGDEKQSIFSFQGAAPIAFGRMRERFRARVEGAEQAFAKVELDLSFRSARLVLESVDAVFRAPGVARGLTVDPDQPPQHFAWKDDIAGMVEIWRPLQAQKAADPETWALPVDQPRESDPQVELARLIARKIKALIAPQSRERVAGDEPGTLRRISPGDVMILVRRRNVFFDAMVRALKEENVPVAGADRLDVGQHIAVMDMLAAARAALLPEDDLALACVLKSPLCDLTDDDLIALAPQRAGSLWEALAASTAPRHLTVADRIADWRARARDVRPFDFFSRLLGPDGGRKAFLERLGPEAGDALDELMALALAHERRQAPSLPAFVHELETIDLTVKRDMDAASGLVRVMTVHAAKGLEAKIVFLPDTCATPSANHDSTLFDLDTPAGPTLAWARRKGEEPQAVALRREALRAEADDEYRRLLYVALTRAEERLYLSGYLGARERPVDCWHGLVVAALAPLCAEAPDAFAPDGVALRIGQPACGDDSFEQADHPPPVIPDWLRRAAPGEPTPAPPLRPSSALAGADTNDFTRTDASASALARGLIVHDLLQSLPQIAAGRRVEAAMRYIRARAPGFSPAAAEALARETVDTLEHPDCAPLFGPTSRAELAIAARIERPDRAALDIGNGRIDRIADVGNEIWIADFKTGAPKNAPPQSYATQLALYRAATALLYPGRNVRAFIVWTSGPRFEEIAAEDLDAALAAI